MAVRDLAKPRAVTIPEAIMTTDPLQVVENPDVDIVVELIGGTGLARKLALKAIAAGKHLVTANKALLAEHGAEIRRAAREAGVSLGFEASVAGGIPVIKTVRESLAANRIVSVYGIINGTSNYILTKMRDEERDFDDILAEAQRAGYAEADPTFDVGGIDTAHKLAILVNLAFGIKVDLADIYTQGITEISPIDIEFGREFGYTLKLLAITKSSESGIEARVHPTMVADSLPIAQVGGVYNAVEIVGDAVGDLMLYGKGAGEMPTASAVVGDIMDISREIRSGGVPEAQFLPPDSATGNIRPIESISSIYYLRFMVADQPGVLSEISGILGRNNISIESVIQKGRETGGPVPLVVMTHMAVERDVQDALRKIDSLPSIREKAILIRVEAAE